MSHSQDDEKNKKHPRKARARASGAHTVEAAIVRLTEGTWRREFYARNPCAEPRASAGICPYGVPPDEDIDGLYWGSPEARKRDAYRSQLAYAIREQYHRASRAKNKK